MVGTTFSLLLALWAPGSVVVPTGAGEFEFKDVQVWRFSEARQERIPALDALLDNRTGKDWKSLRFRVRAQCPEGEQSYEVRLTNILLGQQKVTFTAFDAIGAVAPCNQVSDSIDFLGGEAMQPGEAPTYVVFGFAWEVGGQWTTDLEGILDYRRPTQFRATSKHLYWKDGGEMLFRTEGPEPVAFYSIRVEPGEFGLTGFVLTRDPNDSGPLQRFLRFYMVPPGKAAYLGVFRAFRGEGNETGVRIEADPEALARLQKSGVAHREVIPVPAHRSLLPSNLMLVK